MIFLGDVNSYKNLGVYVILFFAVISLFNYDDIKKQYKYMYYCRVNLLYANNIFINEEITKKSINNTISNIHKHKSTNINLIIDSHGGERISGYVLITEMLKMQKKKLNYF